MEIDILIVQKWPRPLTPLKFMCALIYILQHTRKHISNHKVSYLYWFTVFEKV